VFYIAGITPVVSGGQKATPSIRTENDLSFDIGSAHPITVSSASESSTVGFSTCTTEHNTSASTGNHELLVARLPQEQHDYKEQGRSLIIVILSHQIKTKTLN
jgi:hypothetical protein